jgi:hypothetical protein
MNNKKTSEPATKPTPKFYSHLTIEQKRKLREQLDNVIVNKKKQLELFDKNFCEPIRTQIRLVDDVKKSQISIQHYVEVNEKWGNWIKEFMAYVGKAMDNEKDKPTITKEMENELYSFIVGSNLEQSLIKQLDNKKNKKAFEKWLQVGGKK